MRVKESLRRRWRDHIAKLSLRPVASDILFARLFAAYAHPDRHYHTPSHLDRVFAELDRVQHELAEPERAWMAAWFHDVVYNTARTDNEDRSAQFASDELARLGLDQELRERIATLIRATADHRRVPSDDTDAYFLDADMAILGASPEQYDAYVAGVRAEYAWVNDDQWSKGRGRFLENHLDRDRLFHTDAFQNRLGQQAQANMSRELAALKSATEYNRPDFF